MTTTNLTSDEREELLKQIRERRLEAAKLAWMDHPPQPTWRDIDTLLSLIDNQAKGVSTDMAVLSGYESGLADAATRMRDKCVERLRTLCKQRKVVTVQELASELESLTLDQVEQETK